MIKSYTFKTEMEATKETYSSKDFINNHRVNVETFKLLFHKISNSNQYTRLYTINNRFSTPCYSSRKIEIRYFNPEID